MTEHSFQGIHFLLKKGESVTYVSGTFCYLCSRSLNRISDLQHRKRSKSAWHKTRRSAVHRNHFISLKFNKFMLLS